MGSDSGQWSAKPAPGPGRVAGPCRRPFPRAIAAIAVVAGLTHGLVFLAADAPPPADAEEYIALGKALAATGELRLPTGEVALRMPLYPALIGATYRWQGEAGWPSAVLAFQFLSAWASTLLIAATARRTAGGVAAVVAGLMASLYAPFLYLQTSFLSENLLILLLHLALYLHVTLAGGAGPAPAGRLASVGGLIGLATLCRANALLFVVPFAVDAARRAGRGADRLRRAGYVVLPAVCLAVAWAGRNQYHLGEFTLSTAGGMNLYLGHCPEYAENPGLDRADYGIYRRTRNETGLGEAGVDRLLSRRALEYLSEHPGQTAINSLRKLAVYLSPGTTRSAPAVPVICLAAVVVVGAKGRLAGGRRLAHRWAVALLVICSTWFVVTFRSTYRPWTDPLWVVPAGVAACACMRGPLHLRGLFGGLMLAQAAVAVAYIPLVRLRWSVDGVAIICLAAGVARVCGWIREAALPPAAEIPASAGS